jgi:phage repressor protein C with HTH and peptisase S24 domain
MPDIKQEISCRLKVVRGRLKMSVAEFAQAIGVESQTVRDYENGKSIPGADKVGKLVRLGIDANWLLTGLNDDSARLNDAIKKKTKLSGYQDNETQATYPNYLLITQYQVPDLLSDSAKEAVQDKVIINVSVNAMDWRNKASTNTSQLKMIAVYGDSMLPTLSHGDQVLIDTSCKSFIDDAIYVIQQGGILRIKRVKLLLDGSLEVKSDHNHGFATEKYTTEEAKRFNIVGKVLPFKFGQFGL